MLGLKEFGFVRFESGMGGTWGRGGGAVIGNRLTFEGMGTASVPGHYWKCFAAILSLQLDKGEAICSLLGEETEVWKDWGNLSKVTPLNLRQHWNRGPTGFICLLFD